MFGMFKDLGALMGMLRNMPKLKEDMAAMQGRIAQLRAEGDAGAGLVKVRVNGSLEIVRCELSDEALKMNDREMLEDLIKAATNQALTRVRQQIAEESAKVMTGMGLPPGMNLPGMG